MNASATRSGAMYGRVVLLILLALSARVSMSQSFINFSSLGQRKYGAGIEDNRTALFTYNPKNGLDVSVRHTLYSEKLKYQLVQADIGYDWQVNKYLRVSPRVYGMTNYAMDRKAGWFNTQCEGKLNDMVRVAYGFTVAFEASETRSRLTHQAGLLVQTSKDIALISTYGPNLNFNSFNDYFNFGPLFTSERISAKISYGIPSSFKFELGSFNTSVLYSF